MYSLHDWISNNMRRTDEGTLASVSPLNDRRGWVGVLELVSVKSLGSLTPAQVMWLRLPLRLSVPALISWTASELDTAAIPKGNKRRNTQHWLYSPGKLQPKHGHKYETQCELTAWLTFSAANSCQCNFFLSRPKIISWPKIAAFWELSLRWENVES